MKVILRQVKRETEGGLRTTKVIGKCKKLPTIREPFIMTADPLVFGTLRYIETSRVQSIRQYKEESKISFITENGTHYEIQVLKEKV
jgi:hypothetical protein